MKKKLLIVPVLACAAACAFGLTACKDDPPPHVSGIEVGKIGEEQTFSSVTSSVAYGETLDWNFYKVYARYSNGELRELERDDEKLTASYSYQDFNASSTTELSGLPNEYVAGTYTIEYAYSGLSGKATANVFVDQATSGAFTLRPAKTTWYTNELSPSVTLINPKNATVSKLEEGGALNNNDTNGDYNNYYVIKKSAYDVLTDAQKTDYDFIQEYISNHQQDEEWRYYNPDMKFALPADEYMLFTLVYNTHNYRNVVTSAVHITVKDPFVERVFTFRNLVLEDGSGNEITDPEDEYVDMTKSLKLANADKTVICKQNGEVRGTVDFGNGAFDELVGEDVSGYLTEVNFEENAVLLITETVGSEVVSATGTLIGNTLTLEMQIGAGHVWIMTFTCQ